MMISGSILDWGDNTGMCFKAVGFQVDWREYVGAAEEGHWLKEPEELDAIAEFWAWNMED